MTRTVSSAVWSAINAQETGSVFIVLLTLEHADLDAPIRVTSDSVDTVSRSNTYIPFPFQISMPEDRADKLSVVNLTIDAIDLSVVAAIRGIASAPTVTMEIVLSNDPDTVEAGPFVYTLQNVKYDQFAVTGSLAFEDILNEPFPGGSYNTIEYPGLF